MDKNHIEVEPENRVDARIALQSGVNPHDLDLRGADLSDMDLCGKDFSGMDLSGTSFSKSLLRNANLSNAVLYKTILLGTNIQGSDLSGAALSEVILKDADFSNAIFKNATLSDFDLANSNLAHADMTNTNFIGICFADAKLHGTKGLFTSNEFLDKNFEKTKDGYVVYKSFNEFYSAEKYWDIRPGSIIEAKLNKNRQVTNGCGINTATLKWAQSHCEKQIWKLLIRWNWVDDVCVPYESNGKIRCGRAQIIGAVK